MKQPEINLKQARKVTIVESIIDQLVEQIQSGALSPGDKLPSERQLVEMLGVGRSSVREALQGLVMMGLVEIYPGQGTFIKRNLYHHIPHWSNTDLSSKLQRTMRLDLIEARRVVEVSIARLAATHASDDDLDRMQKALDDYSRYVDDFSDRRFVSAHKEFHMILAEATKNPFYIMLVETLLAAVPQTLREREFTLPKALDLDELRKQQIQIHTKVIHAIKHHNPKEAADAMTTHMDFERDLVLKIYPESHVEG